ALGAVARGRFCSLAGKVNDDAEDETWVRVSPRMRIAAIQTEHFEHVRVWDWSYSYADGKHEQPLADPPAHLFSWRVGGTYRYLIDILDGGRPGKTLFRILYMPSAATHPTGTPSEHLLDGTPIDLAILGAAQLERDPTYPGALVHELDPRAVMLVHWDNFVDD